MKVMSGVKKAALPLTTDDGDCKK